MKGSGGPLGDRKREKQSFPLSQCLGWHPLASPAAAAPPAWLQLLPDRPAVVSASWGGMRGRSPKDLT